MKIANLLKIADGIEQRSKRAAIKRLKVAGLTRDDAEKVLQLVQQRVPNLKGELCKFYDGVVRWVIEDQVDLSSPSDLARLNKVLFNLKDTNFVEFYDKNFNGNSPEEVMADLGADLDAPEYQTPEDVQYEVFNLTEEDLPSYQGLVDWCILDPEVFRAHTKNGKKFYVAERSDFNEVPRVKGPNYPHDAYGMSLIAIGTESGDITSITSRWNFDDYGDSFLTVKQIEALLGDEMQFIE